MARCRDIPETADPRWTKARRRQERASAANRAATWKVIEDVPTTKAGVVALIEYVNEARKRRLSWPDEEADDLERDWSYRLNCNILSALESLAPSRIAR